jgi:hypothetical protein
MGGLRGCRSGRRTATRSRIGDGPGASRTRPSWRSPTSRSTTRARSSRSSAAGASSPCRWSSPPGAGLTSASRRGDRPAVEAPEPNGGREGATGLADRERRCTPAARPAAGGIALATRQPNRTRRRGPPRAAGQAHWSLDSGAPRASGHARRSTQGAAPGRSHNSHAGGENQWSRRPSDTNPVATALALCRPRAATRPRCS